MDRKQIGESEPRQVQKKQKPYENDHIGATGTMHDVSLSRVDGCSGLPLYSPPPVGSKACAVVWLHGMGGTGAVEEEWKRCFEKRDSTEKPHNCAWIHPRAPCGPVTFHRGQFLPRWCDTWGDRNSVTWTDSPEDVAASVALVHSIIRELHVETQRIVIGGFSQGAAIALLATLAFPERLAGCIMFGGWLSQPTADEGNSCWIHESNDATPVWWGHGERDRSIPFELQHEHATILDKLRPLTTVERRSYPSGHWPSPDALRDMCTWLRQRLPLELAEGSRAISDASCNP